LFGLFQRLSRLRLLGQCALFQLSLDSLGQVLGNEALNDLPLVVHDAVDAKVQVGAVELEELTQKRLESLQGCRHDPHSTG
jgi:hypothetical protein